MELEILIGRVLRRDVFSPDPCGFFKYRTPKKFSLRIYIFQKNKTTV